LILDAAPIDDGHGFGTEPAHIVRDQEALDFIKTAREKKMRQVKGSIFGSTFFAGLGADLRAPGKQHFR
jgi:hypothetical protein